MDFNVLASFKPICTKRETACPSPNVHKEICQLYFLVGWHASAVSLSTGDIILVQLALFNSSRASKHDHIDFFLSLKPTGVILLFFIEFTS